MNASALRGIARKLLVLGLFVGALAIVRTGDNPVLGGIAYALSGCCGVDNPGVPCNDCGDALSSCDLACGGDGIGSPMCVSDFDCNPGDPSNYTCVCRSLLECNGYNCP